MILIISVLPWGTCWMHKSDVLNFDIIYSNFLYRKLLYELQVRYFLLLCWGACPKSLSKINFVMTLGGEGVLAHDVLQLHYQQTWALIVIMHSCGWTSLDTPPAVSKFAF